MYKSYKLEYKNFYSDKNFIIQNIFKIYLSSVRNRYADQIWYMCLEDVYIRCDLIDCLLLNGNTWSSSPSFIYLTLTFKMVSFPFPLGVSSSRFTPPFGKMFPFFTLALSLFLMGKTKAFCNSFLGLDGGFLPLK